MPSSAGQHSTATAAISSPHLPPRAGRRLSDSKARHIIGQPSAISCGSTCRAEPCCRPARGEICRLAKREIKSRLSSTKQAVVQFRRDIATLKRQLREQGKEIAFLKAQERKRLGQPSATVEEPLDNVRFSPRSVKAQRHRLRLSAADYGKLVGVSGLTIYHWEHGKARPQKERLAALGFKLGQQPVPDLAFTGLICHQVPQVADFPLTDAVNAPKPLLNAVGVPRQVVVDHQMRPPM